MGSCLEIISPVVCLGSLCHTNGWPPAHHIDETTWLGKFMVGCSGYAARTSIVLLSHMQRDWLLSLLHNTGAPFVGPLCNLLLHGWVAEMQAAEVAEVVRSCTSSWPADRWRYHWKHGLWLQF